MDRPVTHVLDLERQVGDTCLDVFEHTVWWQRDRLAFDDIAAGQKPDTQLGVFVATQNVVAIAISL